MSAAIAATAAIAIGAGGCKDRPRAVPAPAPVTTDARVAGPPGVGSGAATLPGRIWFVDDGPPETLWWIAGGVRTEVGPQLYPTADRLPDRRQVAIWSLGTGAPDSEQLALIADDRTVTRTGPAAAQVRAPAVDPAGAWIVVAANPDGHSDLYRIDPAKPDAAIRITTNPEGNFTPTVLGGHRIAFASSRDGDSEIYAADIDGTHVQRLTAFHRDDWAPVGSYDGKTIAFLSDREGPPRIFLMAPDGTAQRRLTDRVDDGYEESDPVWSPDDKRLVYVVSRGDDRRVVVRELAAGTEVRLTPDGARDADPELSPDGAWIAVARATATDDGEDHELWAIPVAGGAAVPITRGGGAEGLPRWMPD